MRGTQKRSTIPQPTHVPQGLQDLQDQQDLLALRYVLQMWYNVEDETIGLNYTDNYETSYFKTHSYTVHFLSQKNKTKQRDCNQLKSAKICCCLKASLIFTLFEWQTLCTRTRGYMRVYKILFRFLKCTLGFGSFYLVLKNFYKTVSSSPWF